MSKQDEAKKPAEPKSKKASFLRLKKKRHSGWGPVSAILVTLGIYFGAQLLAGVFIGISGSIRGYSIEQTARLAADSVIFQFVFVLLIGLLTLALLGLFIRSRRIKLAQIGLARLPRPSDLWSALVTFGLYFVTLIVLLAVLSNTVPGIDIEQQQQIGFEDAAGFGPLLLVFISLVILPPIVEEILVRGFLYGGLRNKLRPISAGLIASFIFAVAHLQFGSGEPLLWVAAIDTFILSLFLVRLRETTGNLWSGMTVHFMKNGVAFTALFIIGVS
jgi:membrane protease YdiL (CAAX protease family)